MTIRKLLCLCLAMLLCCAGAFAEEDLQAQLDKANATIAELQAQVDKYYPYYFAQVAATYGEDGVIWVEDILAEYEAQAAQFTSYGIDLEAYGLAGSLKQDLVDASVEEAVTLEKAAELGLDQLDAETTAAMETEAKALIDGYVDYYISYFYPDQEATDEMRAEAEAYWASSGMDYESTFASLKNEAVFAAIYDYATADVAITEEEVQAEYETMLADDEATYSVDDSSYNSARTSGAAIAWHPEGYRTVKHVLVKFNDEQAALYSELQTRLSALNAELEALENPMEGEEAEAEPRTADEITADIAACAVQVEGLYSELLPTAETVIAEFNGGASFDELIAKYNEDPGMMSGITATDGYAVAATSTVWDPAFTEGAMSIEAVGGISEPVYGSYGIHVIYYLADVTPGAVALEEIREAVEESALSAKLQATYLDAVASWVAEANVEYHYENLGI